MIFSTYECRRSKVVETTLHVSSRGHGVDVPPLRTPTAGGQSVNSRLVPLTWRLIGRPFTVRLLSFMQFY